MSVIDKKDSPQLFDRIARRYDMTNSVISFGQDMSWRRRLVQELCCQKRGLKVLDLATGTGRLAMELAAHEAVAHISATDKSPQMLQVAQEKVSKACVQKKITLDSDDACRMKWQDATFDAVTIAFGLRNVPSPIDVLKESFRVLRPAGVFLMMEFSVPSFFPAKFFHGFYLRYLMPLLGGVLTGDWSAYAYLSRTVQDFPRGERMARIIAQVGFEDIRTISLSMGAVVIYSGVKPLKEGGHASRIR